MSVLGRLERTTFRRHWFRNGQTIPDPQSGLSSFLDRGPVFLIHWHDHDASALGTLPHGGDWFTQNQDVLAETAPEHAGLTLA